MSDPEYATVKRCALLIEVNGQILQVNLDKKQSMEVVTFANSLCGGVLKVRGPIESITFSGT